MSIGRASVSDRGEIVPCGGLGLRKKGSESGSVGPGSYTTREYLVRKSNPSMSIPRTARQLHEKSYGPGVGQYDP